MEWCDDERNVHVFPKYEPPTTTYPTVNIWKEIHEHLQESAQRSKFDEIQYVEYEFEPLGYLSDIEEDDCTWGEDDTCTDVDEDNVDEVFYKHEYAYF